MRGIFYRNRDTTVTSVLTLPETGSGEESDSRWAGPPKGGQPSAEPSNALPGQLDRWLAVRGAELVALRRHIHANPELSGQEFETAALIERLLVGAGLKPHMLPKGNGVICDIGTGNRVIALRADLDALPLLDTKNVPYRSLVDNVCHACGHDVHTTVVLGTGLALAELDARGELAGRVRLIFQPSEERFPSGAPEIIAEGGLDEVEAIFALHCLPQLPVGFVGLRSGPLTAATDVVEIRLTGRGGHTARPHLTADLVHALSRVVVETPALLGRRMDPRAAASMVFGAIRAGEAANTIPVEGHVRGTVRVLSRDAWHELPGIVPQLIQDAVAGTGVQAEVEYVRGVPPVINDRSATAIMAAAAADALGSDSVVEAEVSMGGEDFAFYLERVPGTMMRLGVGVPGAPYKVDIHQSGFDIDERAIGHGVRVFVHTALAALSAGAF
jgi:amidohydrolase